MRNFILEKNSISKFQFIQPKFKYSGNKVLTFIKVIIKVGENPKYGPYPWLQRQGVENFELLSKDAIILLPG